MELKKINKDSLWGTEASKLNDNFQAMDVEMQKISATTIKDAGVFATLEALQSARPTPHIGDTAKVGTELPYAIYVCEVAGTWKDSGATYSPTTQIPTIEQTTGDSETAVMSQKAVTDELVLKANQSDVSQKLEEISITISNEIINGDYSNGIANWSIAGGTAGQTISSENGFLLIKLISKGEWVGALSDKYVEASAGDKFYLKTSVMSDTDIDTAVGNNIVGFYQPKTISYAYGALKANVRKNISCILNVDTDGTYNIRLRTSAVVGVISWGKTILINLTKSFGAGKEPTVEYMDDLLNTHFNGWLNDKEYLSKIQISTLSELIQTNTHDLALKANHGYTSNPKTLKQVDDEIVDLGKDTYRKITNLIPNGNFAIDSDGNGIADGWSAGGANVTLPRIENNIQYWTGLSTEYSGRLTAYPKIDIIPNHKYYLSFEQKNISLFGEDEDLYVKFINQDTRISKIHNATIETNRVRFGVRDIGVESSIKNVILVDLTETFGEGNELTASEFEHLLNNLGVVDYFDEISLNYSKNSILTAKDLHLSDGRNVQGVLYDVSNNFVRYKAGKNLYNPNNNIPGILTNNDNIGIGVKLTIDESVNHSTQKIKVNNKSDISLTNITAYHFADSNDIKLSTRKYGPNTPIIFKSKIPQEECYLWVSVGNSKVDSAQVEYSSSPTSYEPYKAVDSVYANEEKLFDVPLKITPETTDNVLKLQAVDDRLIINENSDNLKILKEYQDTLNSLLNLKGTNSGSMDIIIPPPGEQLDNFVLKVGLHHGSQRGDVRFDEIFFNKSCKTDFSDLRFYDDTGKMLDFNIKSTGNWDVIKDSKLCRNIIGDQAVTHLSNGALLLNSIGTWISNDNAITWNKLSDSALSGVDSNDNIYVYNSTTKAMYRMLSSENYLAEHMVLDGSADFPGRIGGLNQFVEDDLGNLYTGKYPDGGLWYIQVYKSTDGGASWSVILDNDYIVNTLGITDGQQHVHQLTWDNYTKTLYAGLDGNTGRCYKSLDRGETWEVLPIPGVNADYGLTYMGDGFRLGNGETSILGGYTIYKTTDDVNFYPVLNTFQGVRRIVGTDDFIIAGGNAGQSNKVAQLYLSTDKGETWKTIYAENFRDTLAAGEGVRYFTNWFTPLGSTEEQMIISGTFDSGALEKEFTPPLRLFKGGDNYYGLCYINVGDIPAEGKTITVEWDYLIKYPKKQLYSDMSDIPNLVSHLKLNEGRGNIIIDSISKEYLDLPKSVVWNNTSQMRFGGLYPFDSPVSANCLKMVDGEIKSLNSILPNDNFTITFWMNTKDLSTSTKKFLVGNPSGVHLYMQNYRMYISDGNNVLVYQNMFWPNYRNDLLEFFAISISLKDINGSVLMKTTNGMKQLAELEIINWQPMESNHETYFLGSPGFDPFSQEVSDIRIYNRELDRYEILSIYMGGTTHIKNFINY